MPRSCSSLQQTIRLNSKQLLWLPLNPILVGITDGHRADFAAGAYD